MAKFIALWAGPDDIEGFERHYREVHTEITSRWPRVQSTSITRATGNPLGGDPAYHLVFEATFASEDDLRAMLSSPEMAEAGKDVQHIMREFGARLDVLTGTDF